MPELKTLLKLRGDKEGWKFICDKLLRGIVVVDKYNKNIASKRVSHFTNASDIALLLLLLENNWERWIQSAKLSMGGTAVDDTLLPKMKWTSCGTSGGKNLGWEAVGHLRFNELMVLEEINRRGLAGKQVELEYLEARKSVKSLERKSARLYG